MARGKLKGRGSPEGDEETFNARKKRTQTVGKGCLNQHVNQKAGRVGWLRTCTFGYNLG